MGNRKLFKTLLLVFLTFFSIKTINAAEIDHFEVKLEPEKAKVWESIDLTISAVDKNNNTVTDYEWTTLIFSETNPEVELPIALDNSSYKFTSADQWKVKFENWVKFLKKWVQNINVYDFNDDKVFGVAEIEIIEAEKKETLNIDILSPESWLTIPENKVKVSWSTSKNHKVIVLVNDKEFNTISNSNWIYEVEANNLVDWENNIISRVLNSEWEVVWESKEVKIKLESGNIVIKELKIIPEEVFPESVYEIELKSNPKLDKANILINDELIELKEKEKWLYIWKWHSPKEKWSYNIDVVLNDDLWHELKELWVASLKVKELNSAGNTENKDDEKEEEETKTEDKKEEKKDPLEIKWLKLVELKTKSVLTWDKLENAKSYNIYKKNDSWEFDLIDTVSEAKYEIEIDKNSEKVTYDFFAVKAVWETSSWETYEWDLSEATKVKTGPEMLILFIISMFLWWLFFVINFRKKAS